MGAKKCENELGGQDFDGSWMSIPCRQPAAYKVQGKEPTFEGLKGFTTYLCAPCFKKGTGCEDSNLLVSLKVTRL